MEFRSDDVLRILTEYQVFLLKQIYLGHITSGLINQRRKTVRKESLKDHNKTERQSDRQAIFEFSMSLFREFCSKFDVSEKRLNSFAIINNFRNKI